jgi:hypothetical protein
MFLRGLKSHSNSTGNAQHNFAGVLVAFHVGFGVVQLVKLKHLVEQRLYAAIGKGRQDVRHELRNAVGPLSGGSVFVGHPKQAQTLGVQGL